MQRNSEVWFKVGVTEPILKRTASSFVLIMSQHDFYNQKKLVELHDDFEKFSKTIPLSILNCEK